MTHYLILARKEKFMKLNFKYFIGNLNGLNTIVFYIRARGCGHTALHVQLDWQKQSQKAE